MLDYANATQPDVRRTGIILWSVRLLALVAAGASAYLLTLELADRLPKGCGPASDCDAVLSSRWSRWMGLPVSAFGLLVYAAILLTTFKVKGQGRARRVAGPLLLALSIAAAGSGVWFGIVQYRILEAFCPYCLVVHACGVCILLIVVVGIGGAARRRDPGPAVLARLRRPSRLPLIGSAAAGAACVGVLIGGQLVGRGDVALAAPDQYAAPKGMRPFRAHVARGTLDLDLNALPVIGAPEAQHRVVVLGDYTCPHCRLLHAILDKARTRYGGRIACTFVPVPLGVRCNPLVARQHPRHDRACELATLALAVWRADPRKFAAFDHFLFEPEAPPATDAARGKAAELVGADRLAVAQADPWLTRTLAESVEVYRQCGGGSLPKLVFSGRTYTGRDTNLEDADQVFKVLERELGVTP